MAQNREKDRERGGFYNRLHLPPTTDLARERLDEVEAAISRIEFQLEHEQPDKWASEDEYNQWHNAAVNACGMFRAEKGFLSNWLLAQTEPHLAKKLHIVSESTRLSATEQLTANIAAEAKKLEEKFERATKTAHSPIEAVNKELRGRELLKLKEEVSAALLDANNRAQAIYVGKDSLPAVRSPLVSLQLKIRRELSSVPIGVLKNGLFLIDLVDRAMKAGFIISTGEKDRLEELREKYKS